MVPSPETEHSSTASSASSKRLKLDLLMSVSSLVHWAKRAGHVSTKLKSTAINPVRCRRRHHHHNDGDSAPKISQKSPLAHPKQLLKQISNKAITLIQSKKRVEEEDDNVVLGGDEFGEGGVWQKTILMGDKCQPLDFSGVIYYDSSGKQLNEIPLRSPRASPLPGYLTRGK